MANEFDKLDACSWRGIQFPVSSIEVSFQQDLAEHRYYGVDGASVEATGRGPMNITVHIPLFNGIVPGKGEKWDIPYPNTFRALLSAVTDRKGGILIHPELNEIPCRPRGAEFRHSADHRDGVELTVHFVEADDSGLDNVEHASPVTDVELGALDLDASQTDLRKVVADQLDALGLSPAVFTAEFQDFMRAVTAISDQFSIQTRIAYGKIDQFGYRMQLLGESLVRAKDAAMWPAIDATERVRSGLNWLKDHPPAGRPVLTFIVREDVCLPAVLGEMPNAKLGDIIKLNPFIMAEPVIRKGTRIRYYAPR